MPLTPTPSHGGPGLVCGTDTRPSRHDKHQREQHYRKRTSLMTTDMPHSSLRLPCEDRVQGDRINPGSVNSVAFSELDSGELVFPIVLSQPGDAKQSIWSSRTSQQSSDQTSVQSYRRAYLERELPPLPAGTGGSNRSSTTVTSDIHTESSTKTGARTKLGIFWPMRTINSAPTRRLRPSGELRKTSHTSPDSLASSDTTCVTEQTTPTTRETARQKIRHAISKAALARTKTLSPSPVNITANDLFTDAEVLEDTENTLPTEAQLSTAASLHVISENGIRIPFGGLWSGRKTVVCFIRHFWCPLCQDYMYSISKVNPATLEQAGVDLVIISNGSHKMTKAYRRIFRMPFALYVDPSLRVYHALGMTLRTLDGGSEFERGQYVQHGTVGGIAMVVGHAAKVGMPVWEKGGDIQQLGGEFVLGPGLQCSFAHRMRTTRAHTKIEEVLTAAGIQMPLFSQISAPKDLSRTNDRERSSATLRANQDIMKGEIGCGCEGNVAGIGDNATEMDVFVAAGPSEGTGDESSQSHAVDADSIPGRWLSWPMVEESQNL